MSIPRDHHFIPAFYLQMWQDASGKLAEHTKPWANRLVRKLVSAQATGYKKDLYRLPDRSAKASQSIELNILRPLDDKAARLLPRLIEGREITIADRLDWTRFILSLAVRAPEDLEERKIFVSKEWRQLLDYKNAYSVLEEDPSAIAHWLDKLSATEKERVALYQFVDFFSRPTTINAVARMRWSVVEVSGHLLTSDRPLIATNGIGNPDSYIALPLSQSKLFLAANSRITMRSLRRRPKLEDDVNHTIVARSAKYVWSHTLDERSFYIERYMATLPAPSLVAMVRANALPRLE